MQTALRKIWIPQGVVSMGSECFAECLLLDCVGFGPWPSIEILPHSAFRTTLSLRLFMVPETTILIECDCFYQSGITLLLIEPDSALSEIGSGAFARSHLTFIDSMPDNVAMLSLAAFRGCPIRILDALDNTKYLVHDTGVLLLRISNCIIGRVSDLNKVIIPKDATQIADGCFMNEESIQELVFEEQSKLVCIGKKAFQDTCIESIEIPVSVRTLDDYCFAQCQKLTSVVFQTGSVLETIGARAFEEDPIRALNIPGTVVRIGNSCFKNCRFLYSITFPENSSLQRIEDEAFCTTCLRSVTIPASVLSLGARCFSGSAYLTSVSFADGSVLRSIGQEAFRLTGVQELIIPESVVNIGFMAFAECDNLRRFLFKTPTTSIDSSCCESMWFKHPDEIGIHVTSDAGDEEEDGRTCWRVVPEYSSDADVNSGPWDEDSDDWGWDSD